MKLVIDGVLDQNLPWVLILIGAVIALIGSAFRIPILAFAVGVYLPVYTMAAVFLGGFLRYLLTRAQDEEEQERRREQGVLFGSGLVGGGGLTGVLLALWVAASGGERITGIPLNLPHWASQGLALVTILAILAILSRLATRRQSEG
jgi:uncharacterized oligopeptide transporter (OPT) family protein